MPKLSATRRPWLIVAAATLPVLGLFGTAWPAEAIASWTLWVGGTVLLEEVIFRGVVFVYLAQRWSDRENGVFLAAVVSAVLFGIAHIAPVAVIMAAVTGLVLTRLQLDTRSLLPGMFVHFVYNMLSHFPLDAQGNNVDSIWGIGTLLCAVPLLVAAVLAFHELRGDRRPLETTMRTLTA